MCIRAERKRQPNRRPFQVEPLEDRRVPARLGLLPDASLPELPVATLPPDTEAAVSAPLTALTDSVVSRTGSAEALLPILSGAGQGVAEALSEGVGLAAALASGIDELALSLTLTTPLLSPSTEVTLGPGGLSTAPAADLFAALLPGDAAPVLPTGAAGPVVGLLPANAGSMTTGAGATGVVFGADRAPAPAGASSLPADRAAPGGDRRAFTTRSAAYGGGVEEAALAPRAERSDAPEVMPLSARLVLLASLLLGGEEGRADDARAPEAAHPGGAVAAPAETSAGPVDSVTAAGVPAEPLADGLASGFLPFDVNGLQQAWQAVVDQLQELAERPGGLGLPGWLLVLAGSVATCEAARRQARQGKGRPPSQSLIK